MLVLTRKVQQQLRIGDDITITILGTRGRSVSVGIDAPRAVPIVRTERAISATCHEIDPTSRAQLRLPL